MSLSFQVNDEDFLGLIEGPDAQLITFCLSSWKSVQQKVDIPTKSLHITEDEKRNILSQYAVVKKVLTLY